MAFRNFLKKSNSKISFVAMNDNNAITALHATVMNNTNNIATCKIEATINLDQETRGIIYFFDVN